ncbi:DUF2911 domain-containing protein [Chondrinema litorale]|uniref:DUF2911 domain-containing protein n=1 Tax=Chondrinema litorale TaxID=2994555 RepID=UPI002543BCCE|nr:DUF2911 domain-containing protein [Chondrinema litorale]UZR96815.1 DUF2911 domain-containing protein [Chondrinema litorale]
MKKLQLTLITIFISTLAHAQITIPSPSPEGSVYSKVGLTDVTIDYFRPKVRGRKIFGSGEDALLPYGALWRTGAGNGSILTLSTDAKVANMLVDAGKYLILTIPEKNEWTFILYSDLFIDGANLSGNYKEENVVLKTTVKASKTAEEVQSLTFQISDISDDNTSANIEFNWSNVSFKIPIEVSFDEAVLKDIEAYTVVEPINYIKAARYYYTYNKDLDQALEWVNKYLALEGHDTHFWYLYLKAQILAKQGKKQEAIETANRSIELAKRSSRGDLGYIKRNKEIIESLK